MDDDFENSLCDSESEASWNSEIEVIDCGNSDFEDAPEVVATKALCERGRHGERTDKLLDKVSEFRTRPTTGGSRFKTAVESTTYNKSRSQPAKPDGNVRCSTTCRRPLHGFDQRQDPRD